MLITLFAVACFQTPRKYQSTADQVVLVRDLNGDGLPDIIASGNQVDERNAFSLFTNRGDGTFAPERLIASGFGQKLEDIGDLNRDGVPDIVASDYWASGIVVAGTAYGTATHGGPSLIVDYDHDGVPDVVSLSFGSGNPVRAHFFDGNGDGTLAPKVTFDTNLANGASASARMINGALEILVSEHSGHLGLIRYANGSLSVTRIDAGPGIDLTSTFADVDGDGIADIIHTDESGGIFVTLANADGSFRETKKLSQSKVHFPTTIRVGDIDGDGHADIVVGDFQASTLYCFRGNGTGEFDDGAAIDAGGPVNAFALADVNGDGRIDIVTANNDQTVSVLLNGGCRGRAARH